MKPAFIPLLFFLSLSATAFGQAKKADISDPTITEAVNTAVEKLISEKKLAGAVTLVAQDGKIRHFQAHGVRSLDSGDAMTADTIFRIHSMTKAIVSAAALQQFELGKFKLDDPVAKYLPAFGTVKFAFKNLDDSSGTPPPEPRAMTIEDLFRHTSGLAYSFTAPEPLAAQLASPQLWGGDLGQFCDRLAAIPLMHEPGEAWTYGVSTDVLGHLVEIWSGKPLDRYLADEFFKPLGMKDTGFWIENEADRSRFATMHQTTEDGGVKPGNDPLGQKYLQKPKLISGGGGLVSTAGDYYRFLQMIADGGNTQGHTFLKPDSVAKMTTDRLPDSIPNISFGEEQRPGIGFGLGFSIVKSPSTGWDEAAKLGEFGWGGAASCHYWVSPKDNNLIVITLEQTAPYNWNLERALKPVIYEAVKD